MDCEPKVLQQRSEKRVRFKTRKGRILSLVREVYLRRDVACGSPACVLGCEKRGLAQLSADAKHYVLPDGPVAGAYWELFQQPQVTAVIVSLSTLYHVQQQASKGVYSRVKRCLADPSQFCFAFDNEFHEDIFSRQKHNESYEDYSLRLNLTTARWYANHMRGQNKEIVLITNRQDQRSKEETANDTASGLLVLSVQSYVQRFHGESCSLLQLFESLHASLQEGAEKKAAGPHLSPEMLLAGVRSGQFQQGVIHVSRFRAGDEAFVALAANSAVIEDAKEGRGEVLIWGPDHRNRAVHGDVVALELLPRAQWRAKSQAIAAEGTGGVSGGEGLKPVPTGRVVGVLQRNWRDYVCSVEPPRPDTAAASVTAGLSRVLVVPWDRRIPKIRIATSQLASLRPQRFVVRIDDWDIGDNYPQGHFVRALGPVGSLETETKTILIEHGLETKEFTSGQLGELPQHSTEKPYVMDPQEVASRRDLRQSHLIFSIDPIGCQDVDDTLSIRRLDNGNLLMGVHIADVTMFVSANSLLDVEAQQRSTSIYMADRRFDMLPKLLSADLCSLWSGVDRYAVSVEWELTPPEKGLEVVRVEYFRSVIRSRYKLFYEMAQRVFERKLTDVEVAAEVAELAPWKDRPAQLKAKVDEMRTAITLLVEVASAIKQRRMTRGGLELEGIEVSVRFADAERTEMEDLLPKQPLEMHETIAECMIFANHWVARRILKSFPDRACLRQHPQPRQEFFDVLVRSAAAKGFQVRTESNKALADSLNAAVDPSDPHFNTLLRTMATQAMCNALYFSTGSLPRDQFAHYGLALDLYTHFTSPIRRYADVIVHRCLLAALGLAPESDLMSNAQLTAQCRHMNEQHRAAQNAQRSSTELFQALFFRGKKEDDACRISEAVVYSLRANGAIVFIPRFGIRGAVFLKRQDDSVAWWSKDGAIEWTKDSVLRRLDDRCLEIERLGERRQFRLFDHVTVKVMVGESHTHGLSLRLELMRAGQSAQGGAQENAKAEMIEAVRAADTASAEQRKRAALGDISDSDDEEALGSLYSATSLHHFFRSKVTRMS